MTNTTPAPGLVLVANAPELYDETPNPHAARLTLDVMTLVATAALAYGLSLASRFVRR